MNRKLQASPPRPVAGVNIRGLPIGPEEAFILSYIDGRSTEADLCLATGFTSDKVDQIVTRLVELGAIVFDTASVVPPAERVPRAPPTMSGAFSIRPAVEKRASEDPEPALPEVAVDQTSDLNAASQRQLIALHARLESISHYELLGIDPRADLKAIKAAYFDIVKIYHPDRYFGKSLGGLAHKLGQVFTRISAAHDVLTRAELRAKYDSTLSPPHQHENLDPRSYDPMTYDARVPAREQSEPTTPSRVPAVSAPSLPVPSQSIAPSPRPRPISHVAIRGEDAEARKRALARKFSSSSMPAAAAPVSTQPPPSAPELAAEELKRRYEQHKQSRQQQVDQYVAQADAAMRKNDLVSAANALRIAHALFPEDLPLEERLADVEKKAAEKHWQENEERAKVEASEDRMAEAARSYERAALGKPSARLFERAAFCLLECGGDLKRAGEFAKRAVSMAPQSARCRFTLGQFFAKAKLRESALAELERARALAPDQTEIKDFIRRVKRGDA